MKRQSVEDDTIERAFGSLHEVPPPDSERRAAARADYLARASHYRWLSASDPQTAQRKRRISLPRLQLSRGFAMVAVIAALLFALAAGTGGVLYAADGAAPGEALYGLDQAVESARLGLTREPGATAELLLSLAEERLAEAGKLSLQGKTENLGLAVSGYGAAISSLARTLAGAEGLDASALTALVDGSFSTHEAQLAGIVQAVSEDDPPATEGAEGCVGVDLHPVAESLVELYDVTYAQIMGWFCDDGYGFGEIMHALETAEEAQVPAADLLALKGELGGWGRVWQGLGLIGRPSQLPAGPPEDRPVGPPENVPVGPPADRPVGPPEDKRGQGPPEGRPVGPPEDNPGGGPPKDKPGGGPPEGKPAGPPEGAGPPGEGEGLCTGADPHPKVTKLTETYDVAYDEIMGWFCDEGYGLGEIALALKTGKEVEVSAGVLLERLRELGGWGLVWQELGLIGQPAGAPAEPSQQQNGEPPGGPVQEQNGEPPGGPAQEQNGKPPGGPSNGKQGGSP